MTLYRRLLLLVRPPSLLRPAVSLLSSRQLAFSSAEEAAAELRRRKRRLRIEPPLAPRPSSSASPRDPREPDSTSSLVGPRLSLHNRVQSLLRARDLDAASSAARQALHAPVRPSVFTCNALVAAMHRAGRLRDALDLCNLFFFSSSDRPRVAPNVVSYNLLILALRDSSRLDDALAAYRRLLDHAPFAPSAVTFRHLTRGLVDAGRLRDALLLLCEMLFRGLAADSLVYDNLISGFLARDDLPKALELFDELRDRCAVYDGAVVATFMDWYFLKGRRREAMEAYRDLMGRKFDMGPSTCNALLRVLLRHGEESEAEWLFSGMLSRHAPPKLHALDADTYAIVADARFRNGDPEGAVVAFRRTGPKPCAVDADCFNHIIGKLLETGLLKLAQQMFDEMPERSAVPDSITYGLFVEFCFREGRVDDAVKWFASMEEKAPRVGVDSYNKVFDGLAKAGRITEALEVYGRMRGKGVRADSASYEMLITACCDDGLLNRARALVVEMVRSRMAYSPVLRKRVMEAFSKEGHSGEVERMFESPRLVAPPAANFHPPHTSLHQNQNPGDANYAHWNAAPAPNCVSDPSSSPRYSGSQSMEYPQCFGKEGRTTEAITPPAANFQPSHTALHQNQNPRDAYHAHWNAAPAPNCVSGQSCSPGYSGSQSMEYPQGFGKEGRTTEAITPPKANFQPSHTALHQNQNPRDAYHVHWNAAPAPDCVSGQSCSPGYSGSQSMEYPHAFGKEGCPAEAERMLESPRPVASPAASFHAPHTALHQKQNPGDAYVAHWDAAPAPNCISGPSGSPGYSESQSMEYLRAFGQDGRGWKAERVFESPQPPHTTLHQNQNPGGAYHAHCNAAPTLNCVSGPSWSSWSSKSQSTEYPQTFSQEGGAGEAKRMFGSPQRVAPPSGNLSWNTNLGDPYQAYRGNAAPAPAPNYDSSSSSSTGYSERQCMVYPQAGEAASG